MFRFFARWRAFTYLTLATSLGLASPQDALATEVVPLTLTETIRQAQTVVVGNVVSQNTRWGTEAKRWMLTDYTVAVEEVVVAGEGTLPVGETIVVTYWGGTLDGETQAVTDTRLPAVGERLLLMLKPGWQTEVSFSPVVGLNYGLFTVAPEQPHGPAIVRDAHGSPVVLRDDGQMAWKTPRAADAEAAPASVELGAFVSWLRTNVTAIKSAPSELKPQADRNDPRVLKVFANTPYTPTAADRQAALNEVGTLPATETPAQVPFRAEFSPPAERPHHHGVDDMVPDYSFPRVANLPITVNNFRSTFTPWSPEDQYQLTKWNFYGNIFRVATNPTGSWAWRDGRFDLCGFPSSADMQSQFGSPWDANTIGICYTTWNSSNVIIESDVALNPAFSFTLDDEWVYDGASAKSFRQVMMHELGHMWGLAHQTNFLSIMNDTQGVFRFHGFPYMDDAEAIRAAYPSASMSRTDLGVYLRYSNGTQSVADVTMPGSVTAGSGLTFSNYHVENLGTTTISTPTVEWYLTAARNFTGTYYSLGSTTYGSLNRFQYVALGNTPRTLTVPASVPAGQYYLAAFIRNDSSPSQASFPFSNDQAFSRTKIQVNPAVGSLQVSISPAGAVNAGAQWSVDGGAYRNSGTTASNLSVGNHTVSFKPVTGWTTPANQTVTVSANSTATTTGTYVAQTGSLQVTISPAGAVNAGAQWSVDGGAYQNSGATVSNLSVGSHTVSFKGVSGWNTPSNQTVTVSANTTATSTGSYTAQTGSLQVTISPAGAVSAGAQWSLNGGAYQNSGATVSNLPVGNHTVSFKAINGWNTPSNQTIAVSANSTSSTTGTYVAQTGALQVTISPPEAVSAGAQWSVDGGAYQNSGVTVSNLSLGSHTVSFKPVSGWTTPANQTVTISANTTVTTSGTYAVVQSNPPVLLSAVSRKDHGVAGLFDIALPLSGPVGIEPRRGTPVGNNYIILTFSEPVTVGGVSLTAGVGTVSSYGVSGSTVTVNLTGVSNAQIITIGLTNVSNGAAAISPSISVGILLGDVNATGAVNSGDALATKNRSGQTATSANYTFDVNCDGTINGGDALVVRGRSGDTISP